MANTFFQFKKFIVHQEHSAMKVCTDACLFGAWAANDETIISSNTILDIGAGTGLLSLMLAQETDNAKITAIEIEPAAAMEASSNFALSPWSNRMSLVHSSIQEYSTGNYSFDCIITNPPFFEVDLKSPDDKKNLAAHSAGLPWSELVKNVSNLLKQGGAYYVLIPALRSYTMQKLCDQNGLQLVEEVLVHNNVKTLPIRAMQKFVKPINSRDTNNSTPVINNSNDSVQNKSVIKRHKIFIKDAENKYNVQFISLLKEYYLHL